MKDILKFIDLCRHLPNAENQCVLWTINYHDSIATELYHLQHVMDIGIKTIAENKSFNSTIQFAKWQSINRKLKRKLCQTTQALITSLFINVAINGWFTFRANGY